MDPAAASDMKDVFAGIVELAKSAGPAVAAIVCVIVVMFFGLKWTGVGFTIGSKKTLVDDDKMDGVAAGITHIGDRLDEIDKRVTAVERDIDQRPTKDDFFEVKLALARYEGEMKVIKEVGKQTNATVERIENFMLESGKAAMRYPRRREEGDA